MRKLNHRRSFLKHSGILVAGGAATLSGVSFSQENRVKNRRPGKKEEEVTPVEDLAREHGLLNRLLLIYDEVNQRLSSKEDLDPRHVADSAGIIRNFIEDYHEKLEEDYLFPRFEKANKLTDLVSVLRQQHQAGRVLTGKVMHLATDTLKSAAGRAALTGLLTQFVRMYRPHEAREDTILFPAIRSIVSDNEYDSLGEEFEKKEHQLFGAEGFDGVLGKVARIEKALGIYDLRQYTPGGVKSEG